MANPTQTLRQAPQAFTAYSPEEIKQLREMARQLMEGGQLKPITGPGGTQYFSPMQGLAKVVGSGMGGYQEAKANEMERASKAAFAQQLLGAAQGRSPEAAIGAMANPNATVALIEALSKLLAPQGNVSMTGDSYTHPAAPFFGGGNAPQPVQQGGQLPSARGPMPPQQNGPQGAMPQQPPNPNDIPSGVKMPPGQNLGGPGVTQLGVSAENIPPGMNPADVSTMDWLQKRNTTQKGELDRQQKAEEARASVIASGEAAKPKMANIKQLYEISQNLGNPGYTGRLADIYKQSTGMDFPGDRGNQYAIFDSIVKSLAPEAVQQMAATGRISPAVLQAYQAKGPTFWQDKPVRDSILNSMASPLDLAYRQGQKAIKIADPLQAQASIYALKPDPSPLNRPPIGFKAPGSNHTYAGGDPNDPTSWE